MALERLLSEIVVSAPISISGKRADYIAGDKRPKRAVTKKQVIIFISGDGVPKAGFF